MNTTDELANTPPSPAIQEQEPSTSQELMAHLTEALEALKNAKERLDALNDARKGPADEVRHMKEQILDLMLANDIGKLNFQGWSVSVASNKKRAPAINATNLESILVEYGKMRQPDAKQISAGCIEGRPLETQHFLRVSQKR